MASAFNSQIERCQPRTEKEWAELRFLWGNILAMNSMYRILSDGAVV
jgi:hypothetical protein